MLNVVIDTSVYRNNPSRSSLEFQALEKLALTDSIRLHIPYMVEREFQTQQRELYLSDITQILSGLKGLTRRELSPAYADKVKSVFNELERNKEAILSDAENQFLLWADKVHAIRHPLTLDQASEALEAYFQGKPPFKKIKFRDDIPDSFIARSIEKILNDNGAVHVIIQDEKLKGAFSEHANVTSHSTLSEFIESELIQNKLKELDVMDSLNLIKDAIEALEAETNEITSSISKDIGESVMWKTITDVSIPDDNHEASISMYSEPTEIQLHFQDTFYYGNGSFGIPFTLKMGVMAIYYIFKADYYSMDDRYHIPSVTDHNDHYFEAEDDFDIEVKGAVSISIDTNNIIFEDFSECVDFDSIKIDSIESIELQ